MDELLNLAEYKQQLSEQIGKANLSDFELPQNFKEIFKSFGEYKIEEYYKYTIKVSSRKSVCYIPNQWVYIAAICSNYCIELKKYKQKLKSLGITDEDFEACHPSSSDKTVTEERRSNEYVSQKATDLLSSYDGEDKDLLISFLWDYDSWGGGKNIKRDNDFTISPCLNVANSINSSSSLIGDIAKAISDNVTLYNSLINSTEMVRLLRGNTVVKNELVRIRTAAGFIKEAMKVTLSRDHDFSLLERTRKYTTTGKSLFINGYWLGRDKSQMPSRESDVYTEVEWAYNNKEYVLNVEITMEGMESKLFPVFNDAYKNRLSMEKDINSGDYVLYEIQSSRLIDQTYTRNTPLQQIFYGAPGTGKSHKIKNDDKVKTAEDNNLVFRTTFHPDSDYSTFVGAYKPTISKRAVRNVAGDIVKNTVKEDVYEDCITYSFVPQAFLQAYVAAWNNQEENVFLVIEEINRGNCAQIFGDLFQLLDRDCEGFSEYPIMADNDLRKYLNGKDEEGKDVLTNKDGIKDGKLRLPKNLFIWATMNTSDQSLFPIDSAFKRRWEWVYQPIDTAKETWYVKVGESYYSWTAFLNKVNDELLTDETAEDKHLGFYFCKATEKKAGTETTPNVITAETFVGKVLFYLWNDVFKVYGIPSSIGSSKDWPYRKFYLTNGDVDKEKVANLMTQLKIDTDVAEEPQPEEE